MKRFSIRQLMIVIAVVATVLAIVQHYTFATVVGLYIVALGLIGWLPSRGRSRLAVWGFFASATWLNLSMPLFFVYYPVLHNSSMLFLPALISIPIVAGLGLAWVACYSGKLQKLRAAVTVIVLLALPCSMIVYRWPIDVAFYFSSPGLNRLADRVEAGGTVVPGEWAGIYRVWGSMKDPQTGNPMLVIDPDPGGIFAYARRITSPPDGTTRRERLDGGRWYSIDQD
jgi:hypothetical protein